MEGQYCGKPLVSQESCLPVVGCLAVIKPSLAWTNMSVWLSGNFVSKLSLSCAAPAKSTKKTAQQPALLPVASSHAPADRIVLRKEEEDEDSGEGGVTMMDVDTDDEEEDEEEEDKEEEDEEEDEDETEDDDELPSNILPIPQVWKRKSVGNDGPAPKVQQSTSSPFPI